MVKMPRVILEQHSRYPGFFVIFVEHVVLKRELHTIKAPRLLHLTNDQQWKLVSAGHILAKQDSYSVLKQWNLDSA